MSKYAITIDSSGYTDSILLDNNYKLEDLEKDLSESNQTVNGRYIWEVHEGNMCSAKNRAQEVAYNNSDPDLYGPSECCPENGWIRYDGGSRYSCNWCGQEEIRPAAGFVKA